MNSKKEIIYLPNVPKTLLIVIIVLLLTLTYKKNYPTLKEAVRATSRGGIILEKYKSTKGEYVIIKDSNVLTNGFYYKKNIYKVLDKNRTDMLHPASRCCVLSILER